MTHPTTSTGSGVQAALIAKDMPFHSRHPRRPAASGTLNGLFARQYSAGSMRLFLLFPWKKNRVRQHVRTSTPGGRIHTVSIVVHTGTIPGGDIVGGKCSQALPIHSGMIMASGHAFSGILSFC